MGFLTYSMDFYRRECRRLQNEAPTADTLCRARRLLKLLDDLLDEGYAELAERLEAEQMGPSFLRGYLREHHAAPFPMPTKEFDARKLSYGTEEIELCQAVDRALSAAKRTEEAETPAFLRRLRDFCRWIGYDRETAYLFLLRDTLLPYAYFLNRGREKIFPWLLNRKSFGELTGQDDADDAIRGAVYRALEAGCNDFGEFSRRVLPEIRETMGQYPRAEALLREMLKGIDAESICVIESGCCGTFPLLLMSLDARVDLRMYTTYPYLTEVFAGRIFTEAYEENRLFETMLSQEAYFRYSSLRDGRFYVRKCADAAVEERALGEIRGMLTETEAAK